MASTSAHHATGIAAGVIAAIIVAHAGAGGPDGAGMLGALLAGAAGGTAPDWLEVAWWSRKHKLWITHRTLTHWGVGWAALLLCSYLSLHDSAWAPIGLGFAAGGLMHLLADWPNPLGVPWIVGRHSLNWWKSGRCDLIVMLLAWTAAFAVGDRVLFHGTFTHRLLALLA